MLSCRSQVRSQGCNHSSIGVVEFFFDNTARASFSGPLFKQNFDYISIFLSRKTLKERHERKGI